MEASVPRSEVIITVVTSPFLDISVTLNWEKINDKSSLSLNLFAIWKDCTVPKTIDIQALKCLAVFIAIFLAALETLLMSFARGPVSRS